MSGGGGGPIIIRHLAADPSVKQADRDKLYEIADRSVTHVSFADALAVMRIVWRLVRRI